MRVLGRLTHRALDSVFWRARAVVAVTHGSPRLCISFMVWPEPRHAAGTWHTLSLHAYAWMKGVKKQKDPDPRMTPGSTT